MSKIFFRHKRIAIDFDGTLFKDSENIDVSFQNKSILTPLPHADEVTKWLKDQGFEILIFTCRPDYHREYLESEMLRCGIFHDYILFYTKPRVDLYIDDKGFRFENWNDTKEWIRDRLIDNDDLKVISQQPNSIFESELRRQKIKPLNINRFKKILDVGCGDGECLAEILEISNLIADAVEPDNYLRSVASKRNIYRNIYSNIASTSPQNYDCTLLLGVLEHIDDDLQFLINLSNSKRIYGTVPNADSFHRHVGLEMKVISELCELQSHDLEIGHKRYYSFDSLKNLLDKFIQACPDFILNEYGTCSLKFSSNNEMSLFLSRADHFNAAAAKVGLIGKDRPFGAEIYFELLRKQ